MHFLQRGNGAKRVLHNLYEGCQSAEGKTIKHFKGTYIKECKVGTKANSFGNLILISDYCKIYSLLARFLYF